MGVDARIGIFRGYVFSSDDVAGDVQALQDRGVSVPMEPDEQPWGTFAMFADQDRNTYGLLQPAAG